MAVKSSAVTVTTTATRLDTVSEGVGDPGSAVVVYNNGAATVYLGGPDVTTANGVPVAASSWGPALDLVNPAEGVYGIVAAATVEVRVLEASV